MNGMLLTKINDKPQLQSQVFSLNTECYKTHMPEPRRVE